ncbi:MAG: thioredoxin-dependent thiol peroxidase [Ignavibacteria bacterium]|nr:thioredoxin-dependent thiol peroxidase [Ignavibacteria bacterium]
MIAEGKKAPAFSLPNADGTTRTLKDFAGKPLVLYFYPKDNTPGCTQESCDFRDNFARITATGAAVAGVSADGPASHAKFRDKYGLPFELLSDEKREMLEAYGVWQLKKFLGKEYMGIVRSTVIIGSDGIVARVFPKVKVKGHVDEVLEALKTVS